MRHARLLLAAALLTGCTTPGADRALPTAPDIFAAKGNLDLDSHANWTWYATLSDGTTPTRLYGDGRGMDGAASAVAGESSYPGEACGVRGKLFNSATASNSGDAVFDPNFTSDNTACGGRRLQAEFVAGSPVALYSFTNARQVWQMAAGASKVQAMGFSLSDNLPCGPWTSTRLRFDPAVAGLAGVEVTRLADLPSGARQWQVQSTAPHVAGCYRDAKGGTGTQVLVSTHYLPFRALIVEVPAPTGGW